MTLFVGLLLASCGSPPEAYQHSNRLDQMIESWTTVNIPLPLSQDGGPSASEFNAIRPQDVATTQIEWDAPVACRYVLPGSGVRAENRRDWNERCRDGAASKDENLVTVSISGGGTKSGVFAAEALFELERWRILPMVDAISSVSGGSYAAGLFAASCGLREHSAEGRWNDASCFKTARAPLTEPWRPTAAAPLVPWKYREVMPRVGADMLVPWIIERLSPVSILFNSLSDRNQTDVQSRVMDAEFFDRLNRDDPLRMKDLNPHRPALILNAANGARLAHLLEVGRNDHGYGALKSSRQPFWRLTREEDRGNFSLTDYYFRHLLRSDLSEFPLAEAVSISSAFPLLFDYRPLAAFRIGCEAGVYPCKVKRGKDGETEADKVAGRYPKHPYYLPPGDRSSVMYGTDWKGTIAPPNDPKGGARREDPGPTFFVHLNDGGVIDNFGLVEIEHFLRRQYPNILTSTAEPGDPRPGPKQILTLLVDSSLLSFSGLSAARPDPRGVDSAISPLRVDATQRSLDAIRFTQQAMRMRNFSETIDLLNTSPDSGKSNLKHAEFADISLRMLGEYEQEFDPTALRRSIPLVERASLRLPHSSRKKKDLLDFEDGQPRRYEIMQETRAKAHSFGMSQISPIHYAARLRGTGTLTRIADADNICLRHAARWAVALRAQSLCRLTRSGGADSQASGLGLEGMFPKDANSCDMGPLWHLGSSPYRLDAGVDGLGDDASADSLLTDAARLPPCLFEPDYVLQLRSAYCKDGGDERLCQDALMMCPKPDERFPELTRNEEGRCQGSTFVGPSFIASELAGIENHKGTKPPSFANPK
jgi:hypothetical protein